MENSKIHLKWKGYKENEGSNRKLYICEDPYGGSVKTLIGRIPYWYMGNSEDSYWMKPLKVKQRL